MLRKDIGQCWRKFQSGKVVAICDYLRFLRSSQLKHEKGSLIITSNYNFKNWGKIFEDTSPSNKTSLSLLGEKPSTVNLFFLIDIYHNLSILTIALSLPPPVDSPLVHECSLQTCNLSPPPSPHLIRKSLAFVVPQTNCPASVILNFCRFLSQDLH